MITGQIKNQIDQIWDTFWESAGITNPMTVLEQMTYLFFIKMLDDAQIQRDAVKNQLDLPHASDDTFAYGAVAKSLLAIAKTKKTELLFLALFLRSLAVGGRCASIVPDGVLTGTSNAHKPIRRAIVDGNSLEAVISMPSGVFQPYSGVSTAILIFTKTVVGGTDRVWFYDMKADGYSLDQKRTEVAAWIIGLIKKQKIWSRL